MYKTFLFFSEIKHLNSDLRSARDALKSLHISQPEDNTVLKGSSTRLNNLEQKTKELQNLINLAKQQVEGVSLFQLCYYFSVST